MPGSPSAGKSGPGTTRSEEALCRATSAGRIAKRPSSKCNPISVERTYPEVGSGHTEVDRRSCYGRSEHLALPRAGNVSISWRAFVLPYGPAEAATEGAIREDAVS